jgi:hypothetical protein
LLQAYHAFLGETTDIMAYVAMMAPRLVELHRVVKKVPKLQILTIEDLFERRGVQYPSMILETTHALGKHKYKKPTAKQESLLVEAELDEPF